MSTSTNDISETMPVPEPAAASPSERLAEHPLEVRVCTSWAELESHGRAWERLLASAPSASTFVTREWLAAWWAVFAPAASLLALLFFDAAGEPVGLGLLYQDVMKGPLGLRLRRLRFVGDGSNDSDNLDFLVRPGYEQSCALAFLRWLERRPGWDIGELNTMPSDSPTASWLARGLRQRGWTHALHERPRLVVTLPESWEGYCCQLSTKERGKLRYYTSRLERMYRLRVRKCADGTQLARDLDFLFRLHQKRWTERGEPGTFSSSARRRFYEEVAPLFLARRWLEFWLLELDGKPAAAQFSFRFRDTVYVLQEGFDPEYARDSVGFVLRGQVLQQLIAEGVRRYDFLGGSGHSKQRWNAETWSYLDIHLARPLSRASVYLRALRSGRSAKEWMRANLSGSHFAAGRSAYHWLRGDATRP
jgi:CelD/BcsL family acetyltransferase involved in cellulose biosynthesis